MSENSGSMCLWDQLVCLVTGHQKKKLSTITCVGIEPESL